MEVEAIIEMPARSIFKYEKNKSKDELVLDRPLNQPVPYNYGFIPDSLSEDSDPLDLFLLTDEPIYPLTKIKANIIGVLKCIDNGIRDDKLIATLVGDCRGYETMGTAVIKKYLETYKEGFIVLEMGDKEEAIKIYEKSVKTFKEVTEKSNKALLDAIFKKYHEQS